MRHDHAAGVGDGADVRRVEVPFLEDLLDLPLAALLDDHQHALLRLGEHDLVGIHAGLALGHVVELDLDPGAAAARGLAGRAGEAGRAHVLDADDEAGHGHHLEARLDQQLLHEGIALLDGGPVGRALGAQLLRGEGGAAEAVAAGGGAHIVDGIAEAGRLAAADLVVAQRPEAERVDERVALVGAVEVDVAADRGHADAVAVVGDARRRRREAGASSRGS